MVFRRKMVWALASLSLAAACKRQDEPPPRLPGTSSSAGLPDQWGDGSAPTWMVPDGGSGAEAISPPDLAVDLAESDLAVAAPDTAVPDVPTVLSDADVCGSVSATAKPLPVDIFVLLDRSSSMDSYVYATRSDAGTYLTRWTSMREALTNFVNSPAATGLHVGLGYFPSLGYDECDLTPYMMPTVPIAELPAGATPLLSSLQATSPGGDTPTLPGLQGAIQYAHQREMTLGRRTAIALATDGEPNSCGSSLQAVEQEVMKAASDGIFTFVVGVGESLSQLNDVAFAGGTTQAILVASATPTQLADAFKMVQSQAAKLACTFSVPPPPMGQMLDTDRSAVHFAPTANPTMGFDISMVANRAACTAAGGWYVDDLFAPKTLTLCDASCQKVNAVGDGQVSVQFACRAR